MSSISTTPSSVTVGATYNSVPQVFVDGTSNALQADVNGYLKVSIVALGGATGQQTMANSFPVVIASNQSAVPVSQSGTWNVNNVSGTVTLPTGAATAAKQPALGVAGTASADVISVQGIAGMTAVKVDGSAVVQPVSQSGTWSVRLQDGAGSAVNKGQGAMAASLPVVLASDQSAIPVTQSGTWSTRLQDGAGSAVNKGQGAMAASLPVVIASDQSAVPASQSGTWNVRLQDGAGSAVNKGQGLMAASLPVTLASDQTALSVTPGKLSVVDQIKSAIGPVLDMSVNQINGSAGAFLEIVTSLAAATKQIRVADTGGFPIGVYTGAAASEVLKFIINAGMDDVIEHAIPVSTRVSVRAMASTAITTGTLIVQFQG